MKTFLVALDTSPRASEVLAAAENLARRSGARLMLFRAVGIPREIPVEAYTLSPDALVTHLQERARHEISALAATLPSDLLIGVTVSVGTAWQAICAAAETHDADLIVIGSHGYSGLDHLLGTTAAKVVNHASRSVLVVRAARPPSNPA